MYGVIKDLGNPFQEESRDLLTLDSKAIAAELVGTHLEKGKVSFKEFFNGLGNEASFYKPIKKNKTDFFAKSQPQVKVTGRSKCLKMTAASSHSSSYPVNHVNVTCLSF